MLKKGDLQLCENNQTTSLICHARKVILKNLLRRMKAKLKEEIDVSQAGYTPGTGTGSVRNFLRFIAYSKAFDSTRYWKLGQ